MKVSSSRNLAVTHTGHRAAIFAVQSLTGLQTLGFAPSRSRQAAVSEPLLSAEFGLTLSLGLSCLKCGLGRIIKNGLLLGNVEVLFIVIPIFVIIIVVEIIVFFVNDFFFDIVIVSLSLFQAGNEIRFLTGYR